MNCFYKKISVKEDYNFDHYISLETFRDLYKNLLNGSSIEISKKNNFNLDNLNIFIEKAIANNLNGNLYTDNPEVLKKIERAHTTGSNVLIIDNHNFFHRAFHAVPRMVNEKGENVAVLKAFANLLKWIFETQQNNYSYVIFTTESKFLYRKEHTKNTDHPYKGNRSKTEEELKTQIKMCEDFIKALGYPIISVNGYESDDVTASLVKELSMKDISSTAFSSDKDMFQLACFDNFKIMDPKTKESFYAKDMIIDKYGVTAEQFIDYQGFVGDTADNVPGIKGVGPALTKELLSIYGSIENLYKNIEKVGLENFKEGDKIPKAKLNSAKKKQDKLLDNKDTLFESRDLCRLRTYLFENENIGKILKDCRFPGEERIKLLKDILMEKGVKY